MTDRQATCSCGNLVIHTRGEPVRVSVCHCLACQKRTGSVFGAQARFALDAVRIEGRSSEYIRVGESGHAARFQFCAECGATVSGRATLCRDSSLWRSAPSRTPVFPRRVCRCTKSTSTPGCVCRTTWNISIDCVDDRKFCRELQLARPLTGA
jgi:hypothetical protein